MLNRMQSEIRRQGLCLEGNSGDEMKRHIAEHCIERNEKMERYEQGRTTTLRMGMKDMIYLRNYRANERKFQHGPILRGNTGKCLVFVDKSSWANIEVVKSCEWSTI
jgi:hypothetical protein